MAAPRIFVSSTCYDLFDLRNNLRAFIEGYGYEPVMSEFGDIFFDFNMHVQDACLNEIKKCQMFILIIGNNYGSFYHNDSSSTKGRSSVTMREFKESLNCNIPKHIFINDLVKYDYDNYRRFLDKEYADYFREHEIDTEEVEEVKNRIRDEFDNNYYFIHKSYKHIFKFIDSVYDLRLNNAIYTFKLSEDIDSQLKKQWAGLMYESLTSSFKKNPSSNIVFDDLVSKINSISDIIQNLVKDEGQGGKVTLDINNLNIISKYKELEEYQELLHSTLTEITSNKFSSYTDKRRGVIYEEITFDNVQKWLDSLSDLLEEYKWSKTLEFKEVFSTFDSEHFEEEEGEEIQYKLILTLNELYTNIENQEVEPFINSVQRHLKILEDIPHEKEVASTSEPTEN